MDRNYIQNIMGSPYIDEERFPRLRAWGARARRAYGAMRGRGIENPQTTQLRSLWEGLMKSLSRLMEDWSNVSNGPSQMLQSTKLNRSDSRVKNILDQLAVTIRPTPDMPGVLGVPSKTTGNPKLKELAEEGMWTRGFGLNKAISSNNPTTILNAYKNKVLSLYQKFLNDAVKMTKLPKNQIYGALAKIQPSMSKALIMQKIAKLVANLQSTGSKKTQQPGVVPAAPQASSNVPSSAIPTTSSSGLTSPTTQPLTSPVQPQAATSQSVQPPTTPQPTQPQAQPQSQYQTQPSDASYSITAFEAMDLAAIIDRAVKIIIDAVEKDISHTANFFKKPLPTSWHEPQLTREEEEPDIDSEPSDSETGAREDDDDAPEIEGEFVYNFHGRHHKKHTFSIQVKPQDASLQAPLKLPSGKEKKIEVWWHNKSTKNEIYVVTRDTGDGSVNQAKLMTFYDHEVSPEMGGITPGSGNEFSIEKTIQKAHPMKRELTAQVGQILSQTIDAKTREKLFRALYATTTRKAMEWKVKKPGAFSITFDPKNGDVYLLHPKKGEKKKYTQAEVQMLSQISPEWFNTLEHYRYFKTFPGMKKAVSSISDIPQCKEAIDALIKAGMELSSAERLVIKAFVQLRQAKPAEEEISKEEILNIINYKPNASAYSWDDQGTVYVKSADKSLGIVPVPQHHIGNMGAEVKAALAKAGYWKKFPDAPGNPDKKTPEDAESSKNIEIWKDPESGKAMWKNKVGDVESLSDETIEKFKTDPEFIKALKDAKANGYKPPEEDKKLTEEFINPFQSANFLL